MLDYAYLSNGPHFKTLQQLIIRLSIYIFKIHIREGLRIHFLEFERSKKLSKGRGRGRGEVRGILDNMETQIIILCVICVFAM